MKRKAILFITAIALSISLSACGKEETVAKDVNDEYRVDTGKINYSDVNDAIYDVTEVERNNKYSNSAYVDSVITIGNSEKYIQVSVPKDIIEASVSSITDGNSVKAPIKNDICDVTLYISAIPYNYENGNTEQGIINASYNRAVNSSDYEIVYSLSGTDGSYKYVADKVEYGTNSKQRFACKTRHYGDAVVIMELQTSTESGNMENMFSADRAYDILDSINFKADFNFEEKVITAEMAREINESNKLTIDEGIYGVMFENPEILLAVQNCLNTEDTAFSEEDIQSIEELNIELGRSIETDYTDEAYYNLSDLQYFNNLKKLRLYYYDYNTGGRELDYNSIPTLSNLETLEFKLCCASEGDGIIEKELKLDWLSDFKNLKNLNIELDNVVSKNNITYYVYDITPLSNLTSLEYLRIMSYKYGNKTYSTTSGRMNGTIQSIEPLRNLTNLKTLNIQYAGSDISALASLQNLEDLTMSCMANDVSVFYQLENLKNIDFTGDEYDLPSDLNRRGHFEGNMVRYVD